MGAGLVAAVASLIIVAGLVLWFFAVALYDAGEREALPAFIAGLVLIAVGVALGFASDDYAEKTTHMDSCPTAGAEAGDGR